LPFERRGPCRRHRFRTRSRKICLHQNGRIINVRQIAHGQIAIADQPKQENTGHDQPRHYRPPGEQFRDTHETLLPSLRAACSPPCVWAVTGEPSFNRNCPSVTTVSPACTPFSTTVIPPRLSPTTTGRFCTVESAFTMNTKSPV